MLFRSRYHKKYLLAVILATMFLLIINTQLQVTTFRKHFTLEITETSATLFEGKRTDNVTQIYERADLRVDDPTLVTYIRGLIKTAENVEGVYNLSDKRFGDRSRGQALQLDVYFRNKRNGYFLEIGAGDGESESITLMLERERQWTGLLIEPDPIRYKNLVERRRLAKLLNACVKTSKTQQSLVYNMDNTYHRTPCFWIESILLANAIGTVDVLCVDVNGQEEDILKSFPFDTFRVNFVTVELNGKFARTDVITILMKEKGFKTIKLMSNHISNKTDIIFAKE